MGFEAKNRWHAQMRKFHLYLNDIPNPVLMTNSVLWFFLNQGWLFMISDEVKRSISGGFNKDKIKPEMRVRP